MCDRYSPPLSPSDSAPLGLLLDPLYSGRITIIYPEQATVIMCSAGVEEQANGAKPGKTDPRLSVDLYLQPGRNLGGRKRARLHIAT